MSSDQASPSLSTFLSLIWTSGLKCLESLRRPLMSQLAPEAASAATRASSTLAGEAAAGFAGRDWQAPRTRQVVASAMDWSKHEACMRETFLREPRLADRQHGMSTGVLAPMLEMLRRECQREVEKGEAENVRESRRVSGRGRLGDEKGNRRQHDSE